MWTCSEVFCPGVPARSGGARAGRTVARAIAGRIQQAVDAAYAKFKTLTEGKNADYIPALAKVDPNLFGIAVVTADGKVYTAGDVQTQVSIQSISKVFTMAQVIQEQGPGSVENRIGVDATGARFNSIIAVGCSPTIATSTTNGSGSRWNVTVAPSSPTVVSARTVAKIFLRSSQRTLSSTVAAENGSPARSAAHEDSRRGRSRPASRSRYAARSSKPIRRHSRRSRTAARRATRERGERAHRRSPPSGSSENRGKPRNRARNLKLAPNAPASFLVADSQIPCSENLFVS